MAMTPRLVVCALLLALGLAAAAQPTKKVPRIGYLAAVSASADAPRLAAFRQGLRELGYVEGQTIQIEYRHESADLQRLPEHAAELVRMNIDLLVAVTSNAAVAAKKTTSTVPIVFMGVTDPIATGLAESLARPGSNATGVTNVAAILTGKRLELLKEMVPKLRRVGVLANPLHPGQKLEHAVVEEKARQLGLHTTAYSTSTEAELDAALKSIAAAPPDGLLVLSDGFVVVHRRKILDFALARRLPVISGWALMADSGALCTYGPRLADAYARVGYFVDRILKGAAASSLPIEQPTNLELVVNRKTAKQLGVSIPPGVLARADRVIE